MRQPNTARRWHLPHLRRPGIAWRARLMVAMTVIVTVAMSLAVLLLLTRSWMVGQIDAGLSADMARLVETYDEDEPLADSFVTIQDDDAGNLPGVPRPTGPRNNDWDNDRDDDHDDDADDRLVFDTPAAPQVGERTPDKKAKNRHLLRHPEPSEGSIFAIIGPNGIEGIWAQRYHLYPLDEADLRSLLAQTPHGRPHHIDLPEAEDFRFLIHESNGITYMVGRGMGDIDEVLGSAALGAGAIVALAAISAALVSGRWVRKELQPLEDVVGVSQQVSQELARSGSPGGSRVDMGSLRATSEVAQVAEALNALVDTVDSSLVAKEKALDQLRQFVADASHELRTPLASIRGYTQLLAQDATDKDAALERIGSESARMSDLVEDLLLLARLDAGRRLDSHHVDVLPIAVESLADANAVAPDHQWSIDFPEESIDECAINGDEAALRQVLANLLANARHHTPAGTAVHLAVTRAGEWVQIDVSDNGPGIPSNIQATLFDRFVRGECSRARTSGGSSGLGLAIVKALVEEMGGHIEVASGPGHGQGTCFRLRFPGAPLHA